MVKHARFVGIECGLRVASVFAALAVFLTALAALATAPGMNGRLAFVGPTGEFPTLEPGIYTIGLEPDAQPVRVSQQPNGYRDTHPVWSPDGTKIAAVRTSADLTAIFLVEADGSNYREIVRSTEISISPSQRPIVGAPTWSPDGDSIAFAVAIAPNGIIVSNSVQIVQVNGTGRRLLTTRPFTPFTTSGLELDALTSLAWSPTDRSKILYLCPPTPASDEPPVFCLLNERNGSVTAGQALPETFHRGSRRAQWQPDGKRLVFDGGPILGPSRFEGFDTTVTLLETGGIFSVRPDGTDLQRLTEDRQVECRVTSLTVLHGTVSNFVGSYPSTSYLGPVIPSPDGRLIATNSAGPATCDQRRGDSPLTLDTSLVPIGRDKPKSIVWSVPSTARAAVIDFSWQAQPLHTPPAGGDPNAGALTVVLSDGHGHPLDGLILELRRPDGTILTDVKPTTQPTGVYRFDTLTQGSYVLRARLAVARESGIDSGFLIAHAPKCSLERRPKDPQCITTVWAEWIVEVPAGRRVVLQQDFANGASLRDSSIPEGPHRERLDDLAALFYSTMRYASWVDRTLAPGPIQDVIIYAFAEEGLTDLDPHPPDLSAYKPGFLVMLIGVDDSDYRSRDGIDDAQGPDSAPENGEWHEFNHHLLSQAIGIPICAGGNHMGYLNPDTCDSLDEGLAAFLAGYAGRELDGNDGSFYDDLADLEGNFRVHEFLPSGLGREDLAVAALLWDLVDTDEDWSISLTLQRDGSHWPVTYVDRVSLPLQQVWSSLSGAAFTVADLRQRLGDAPPTIDLDFNAGLDTLDVAELDVPFLMHGFFPSFEDDPIGPAHTWFHYNVDGARVLGRTANADVGFTSRSAFTNGVTTAAEQIPRRQFPYDPQSNIALRARDAAGRPLSGVDIELESIEPPLPDLQTTSVVRASTKRRYRRLDADGLLHLELPPVLGFDSESGQPLGDCSAVASQSVDVRLTTFTIRARINGTASPDVMTLNGCAYEQARSAGVVLSHEFTFPEDAVAPASEVATVASPAPLNGFTTGSWMVTIHCSDPAVAGFASGCARVEYRLDGDAFREYHAPFIVGVEGMHTLEYRAVDAVGNAEPVRTVALNVGGDTDGDGLQDPLERALGTDPQDRDSDDDGAEDGVEVPARTNPLDPDSDDDGLLDGQEFQLGTDALSADSDSDGLSDGAEVSEGANPRNADSDGDAVLDGADNCRIVRNASQLDSDRDGRGDSCDNCSLVANANQRNTDGDRYGNLCDADFDQSGFVNSVDASIQKARMGSTTAPDQDLNGDGVVNASDVSILRTLFGRPPGPGVQ